MKYINIQNLPKTVCPTNNKEHKTSLTEKKKQKNIQKTVRNEQNSKNSNFDVSS